MRRREFGKRSLDCWALLCLLIHPKQGLPDLGASACSRLSKDAGLTQYVGQFVLSTKYENIPGEVIELGKKSILDGFGLALAGSRAESGTISRKYIEKCGGNGKATVIGTAMKTSPRFAALLNGISIHADDFDYTQLAGAKDRVYELPTHPTVPVLLQFSRLQKSAPSAAKTGCSLTKSAPKWNAKSPKPFRRDIIKMDSIPLVHAARSVPQRLAQSCLALMKKQLSTHWASLPAIPAVCGRTSAP